MAEHLDLGLRKRKKKGQEFLSGTSRRKRSYRHISEYPICKAAEQ